MNGDGEGETADNIKEDMTASLKQRFFKMKKCVLVPRSTRNRVQLCVCGGECRCFLLQVYSMRISLSLCLHVQPSRLNWQLETDEKKMVLEVWRKETRGGEKDVKDVTWASRDEEKNIFFSIFFSVFLPHALTHYDFFFSLSKADKRN